MRFPPSRPFPILLLDEAPPTDAEAAEAPLPTGSSGTIPMFGLPFPLLPKEKEADGRRMKRADEGAKSGSRFFAQMEMKRMRLVRRETKK